MPTLLPSAIVSQSGLYGSLAALADDPASPDEVWLSITEPTGAKWYVRPTGTGTNGDGTSYATAWRGFSAIQWASLQPNDVLYIAGTHYGFVRGTPALNINAAGGEGSPLTISSCETQFGASDNDAGTICGGVLLTSAGWSGPTNGVYSRTLTAVTDQSFLIEADGTVCKTVFSVADCEAAAGRFYSDMTAKVVYYRPYSSLGDVTYGGMSAIEILNSRSWITIQGLRLRQSGNTGYGILAISRAAAGALQRGIRVIGNEFRYAGLKAIQMSSAADTIEISGNTFIDCACVFYPVSCCPYRSQGNVTFSNNEMYHTANVGVRTDHPTMGETVPFISSEGEVFAIGTLGGINNFKIENNYIHDWKGEGIFCYLSGLGTSAVFMADLVIANNRVFLDASEPDVYAQGGIQVGGGTSDKFTNRCPRTKIYNNIIANCRKNTNPDPAFDWVANWSAALRFKYDKPTDPDDTAQIYNNTIYNSYIGVFLVVSSSTFNAGMNFRNNIIASPSDSGYFIWHGNDADQSGVALDYNCYHGTGLWKWDGSATNITSIANWRTATGGDDTNSVTGDPQFTDAAAYDFTIGASSSCLNTGTDTGLTYDFANNPRPVGAYDIGAYERQ